MNGEKKIEFVMRKPLLGSVATALYLLGVLVISWTVPRSVMVPVAVAEFLVYVVAFLVIPALLRRSGGLK